MGAAESCLNIVAVCEVQTNEKTFASVLTVRGHDMLLIPM